MKIADWVDGSERFEAKFNENEWKSMNFNENKWKSMKIHEKINENQWNLMKINEKTSKTQIAYTKSLVL